MPRAVCGTVRHQSDLGRPAADADPIIAEYVDSRAEDLDTQRGGEPNIVNGTSHQHAAVLPPVANRRSQEGDGKRMIRHGEWYVVLFLKKLAVV